jgi:hypothetical protein
MAPDRHSAGDDAQPGPVVSAGDERRAQFQLLFVLAFAWIGLAAYSLSGQELQLFGSIVAKAPIADYLSPEAKAAELPRSAARAPFGAQPAAAPAVAALGETAEAGGAVTPAPSADAPAPAARPVDRAPQRILMIGDSMVKNLMRRMADYALENGHQLRPAVWPGSTTDGWAARRKLDTLIAQFDPTFVIVVLGSSEIFAKNMDRRALAARRIVQKIGSRKYVWLGPPLWRKDNGIDATLAGELGAGHYFRGAGLELPREADGIHPTRQGGSKWMDAACRWIVERSEVPILLESPQQAAPYPNVIEYPPAYEAP